MMNKLTLDLFSLQKLLMATKWRQSFLIVTR